MPTSDQNTSYPPSVDRVLAALTSAVSSYGRDAVACAAREALEAGRERWRQSGAAPSVDEVAREATALLERASAPSLQPAVNATGIVLHTGLGRSVLPPDAVRHAGAVLTGHCALEIDPDSGERRSRNAHVEPLLCALTGAEAAFAVNNDAGAVLLALAATARDREVIVSRGELVEIGGGFRIPDVMTQSGARLVEVGTTNKTRAADYAAAIGPNTGAILKVHPSNFRIIGFTESAPLPQLAAIAREAGIPLIDDFGSGALVDLGAAGIPEPTVAQRLGEGADLVLFSGDKLLGGPQAGIAAGRSDLIDAMKRHPLARALRCDKVTLALLEGTLRLYRRGALDEIPTLHALRRTAEDTRRAARRLAAALNRLVGVKADVAASEARVGAGSVPEHALPSFAAAVSLVGVSASELAARLRAEGVYGHIALDRLLLETRTLLPGDEARIVTAMRAIAAG